MTESGFKEKDRTGFQGSREKGRADIKIRPKVLTGESRHGGTAACCRESLILEPLIAGLTEDACMNICEGNR